MASIVEHKTGDGRVARGERTRRALAEALISLLEEGDAQPTARRIAERAESPCGSCSTTSTTSNRSSTTRCGSRNNATGTTSDQSGSTLPVDERVAARRPPASTVFQAIAPVRRSSDLIVRSSPTVEAELGVTRMAPCPAPGHLRPRARASAPGRCPTPSRRARGGHVLGDVGAAPAARSEPVELPTDDGDPHRVPCCAYRQQEQNHERPPNPRRALRLAGRVRLLSPLRGGAVR